MKDIDIKDLSVEDFIELKKQMDEAENDTTPYAVVDNDEISVVGDPNNTELEKHDYVMGFLYPNTDEWRKQIFKNGDTIINETPNYIMVKRMYEDVWVPPRIFTNVQTSVIELLQFFNVVMDDGEIRDMEVDEMLEALKLLKPEMVEAMCHVMATVLRIPYEEEEYMSQIYCMRALVQLAAQFPEVFNGADFFSE